MCARASVNRADGRGERRPARPALDRSSRANLGSHSAPARAYATGFRPRFLAHASLSRSVRARPEPAAPRFAYRGMAYIRALEAMTRDAVRPARADNGKSEEGGAREAGGSPLHLILARGCGARQSTRRGIERDQLAAPRASENRREATRARADARIGTSRYRSIKKQKYTYAYKYI